jgi:hypothetical protein
MKETLFMKEKDMLEMAFLSGEGTSKISEGGKSTPPHPGGRMKENKTTLIKISFLEILETKKPLNGEV